jgi:16S rRNA (guanine(966)-N(2))-methyltransferase RsmD
MRIIAGRFKGRRLNPPSNLPTRPTTDFAKEGLFNVLENNWDLSQVEFLDLFAGTGNISFEMASRGCESILAIDLFPGCVAFINKTIAELKVEGMDVIHGDVLRFIPSHRKAYDLIFCGPPYALLQLPELPEMVITRGLLKPKGWFILEHNPNHRFQNHPHFVHHRNYGSTHFSIFGNKGPAPEAT